MKFIELTFTNETKHYYNIDNIVSFGKDGEGARIYTTNNESDRVKETPLQIIGKIAATNILTL
jgi:hypothetical protein